MTIAKLSAENAGCYADSNLGQYASAEVVKLAEAFGWPNREVIEIAARHWDCMRYANAEPISDDELDLLIDSLDSVELWLNEHVAPEGYSFGWHDGEFFLWSNDEWESEP